MKKIILFLGFVCFFTAFTAFKAKPNGDTIVKVDVTGDQFANPCTGGTLTVLSGVLQFNIAPDGFSIRSTVIHNVVRDDAGTIYHGIFVETFELKSVSPGAFIDNFNWVLSPQGGGTNINIHGVLHISVVNGVSTAVVDKFTLDCH